MTNDMVTQDWYQHLIEDCHAIITERVYRARQELIECWHEVGERIVTEKNLKWKAKGNGEIIQRLAADVGVSAKSIYQAIQFYKKYPDVSHACETWEEGKNISWKKITEKYLPEPPKDETPALPDGKYRVFYADPPWFYTNPQHSDKYNGVGDSQMTILDTHYPSMTISELCALPVKDMAQPDAVLFLWVTSPVLDQVWDVITAWGFEYKTSIVWDKDAHNVGAYVSVRHEFLLICTRGSCTPDISELLPSVVREKRTAHSVKPETFRMMIDKMYPKGRRIELFARRHVEGWDAWGLDA